MILGIVEPVDAPLRALLRRAVVETARAGGLRRRRRPALHAGVPGGTSMMFEPADTEDLDLALRADVVEAMLRRLGHTPAPPLVRLTRTGPPAPEDADLAWLAAARVAAAELELALRFVVVGPRWWTDPVTGVGQRWTRTPRTRR